MLSWKSPPLFQASDGHVPVAVAQSHGTGRGRRVRMVPPQSVTPGTAQGGESSAAPRLSSSFCLPGERSGHEPHFIAAEGIFLKSKTPNK